VETHLSVYLYSGKPPQGRFPRLKKPDGKPAKPTGSLMLKNFRHGLGVGTVPVHVPGQTDSTGNWPNRPGSQRFGKPWLYLLAALQRYQGERYVT
jgi:hypothetical protein